MNLFVSCQNLHPADVPYKGAIGWDLRNNIVRDNTVVVSMRSLAIGNALSYDGTCSATQADPYLNGSKKNLFQGNRYTVPQLSGTWWMWGGWKTWREWQATGMDTSGTLLQ